MKIKFSFISFIGFILILICPIIPYVLSIFTYSFGIPYGDNEENQVKEIIKFYTNCTKIWLLIFICIMII